MSEENPTWLARLTTGEEAQAGSVINRLDNFSTGESRTCPICDKPIEKNL